MATRHNQVAAAQNPKAGVAKQQKGAENNNRRALGDIGNIVNPRHLAEGKPHPQISRPITRSFGAQLLRNAEANAAVAAGAKKKSHKPAISKADVPVEGRKNTKKENAAEAKSTANPGPPPPPATVSTTKGSSSSSKASKKKKTIHTLTSVLTARSKDACGIKDRPKEEEVNDIDASDSNDQLAVVDYVEDIYKYYKFAETQNGPCKNYIESQAEINAKMRAVLVDWLIEVHHKFELAPETLYLTINIIDRYLSLERVLRRELQLVGISAMLIACKYEEIWAPEVNDFICISDRAYTREHILGMEKTILNMLEWCITVPTPYVFLVRFLKAAISDKEMEHMTFFFAELALLHYSTSMNYMPSILAAAAIYVARCTLNKAPLWTSTLKHYTGYSTAQLHDCAMLLVKLHSNLGESKLKVLSMKYSSPKLGAVALRSPTKNLREDSSTSS